MFSLSCLELVFEFRGSSVYNCLLTCASRNFQILHAIVILFGMNKAYICGLNNHMHLHLKPPTVLFSYYPQLREAISVGTTNLCRKWPTSWLIVWDLNVFFPCTVSSLVTRALHPLRKRSVWRDLGWKSPRVGAEEFISSRWWRVVLELCRSCGVVCKRSLQSWRRSLKLVNADLYVIVPCVENSQ